MTTSRIQITMAMSEGSANTTNSPAVSMNSVVDNLLVYPQFAVSEDNKEEKAAYNEEHPNVLAVKDTLLQICRKRLQHYDLSDLNLSLDEYVKQTLEHFIKECMEVISWLEKDSNNHSILYYANTLPACVKKATELLTKLDPTYLSNKTINLDKTFLKEHKVDFANIKKNMAGETLKNLQLTPSTTKVYLPTCYGYGDEDKEEGLYQQLFSTIKKYLNSGILPENIYVYFGPYEPVGYSIEEREIREEQVLQDLLLNTANYLRAQQINILIHKDKYKLFPTKGLTATDWVDSAEYKHATKVFYQLFANPKNADLHDNFRFDVISYLKPKFDKLKSKALVVLPEEKNRHASDEKPDCEHCIQKFETMLMPVRLEIRLQMAFNVYMYNSIVAMLSQREESRFYPSPNTNPILSSENYVANVIESKEEKDLTYSEDNKEQEDEKGQLVTAPVKAIKNKEFLKDREALLSDLRQVIRYMPDSELKFETIMKSFKLIITHIENEEGVSNDDRVSFCLNILRTIVSCLSKQKYASSFLNCFLNKICKILCECSLFKNLENLRAKERFLRDILELKKSYCPLEVEVEKFIKIFPEINSGADLRFHLRETLKSIKKIVNDYSLSPSYELYIPIFNRVMSTTFLDDKSFFIGFKLQNKQELFEEIANAALENRGITKYNQYLDDKSIFENILPPTFYKLLTGNKTTSSSSFSFFGKATTIKPELRNALIAHFHTVTNSFENFDSSVFQTYGNDNSNYVSRM